jgi:hypothetical protein
MYGILVAGRRPKSKKAVKEALAAGERVSLEDTSFFGGNYAGPVAEAPVGTYTFVGPDPYNSRVFYGNIVVAVKGGVRTVKVS